MTNALSQVTNFTSYDNSGRLLSMTDPNGVVTTMTYDVRGRIKTRVVDSATTTFDYITRGLYLVVSLLVARISWLLMKQERQVLSARLFIWGYLLLITVIIMLTKMRKPVGRRSPLGE